MDEARVVINIKKGVIELEGPVDFVRHYLDTYQFAIKELQGLPKGPVVSPQKAKALPREKKGARGTKAGKRERRSCAAAIRSYLEEGFFDEPRSTGEVKQHLSEMGVICTDGAITASLRRMSMSGSLDTTGTAGRALCYHRAKGS